MRVSPAERDLADIKSVKIRFFKTLCTKCKYTVYKEKMWAIPGYHTQYVCTKCAPDRFDAYEIGYGKPYPTAK